MTLGWPRLSTSDRLQADARMHSIRKALCSHSRSLHVRGDSDKAQRRLPTVHARSNFLRGQALSCNSSKQTALIEVFCSSSLALLKQRRVDRHFATICNAAHSSAESQQRVESADTASLPPGQHQQPDHSGESCNGVHMFQTMQSRLNFKYPRACKMLLLFWSMAALRESPKEELSTQDMFDRSHHCL